MINWKTKEEIEKEGIASTKAVYLLFGIYIWEICMTSNFELSIFMGRRKFAWPLSTCASHWQPTDAHMVKRIIAFVFLCRYSILFALVGLIISDHAATKINCGVCVLPNMRTPADTSTLLTILEALYTFTSVAGKLTVLSASTSLMIRAMALWEWKRWAVLSMLSLSLGQWAILIRIMMVMQASWDDRDGNCVVVNTNHILLILNYVYTMAFDFMILAMTTFALRKRFRHEALSGLLFRDGLVYFLVASACNTVPAVLAVLNLNDEMNVIATVPAAAVSAIAACRAVIRLQAFNTSKREKSRNNSSLGDGISNSPLGPRSPTGLVSFLPSYKAMKPQVHVTTERIMMDGFGSSQSATSKSPCDHERDSDGTSVDIDSKYPDHGDRCSTAQLPQHIHFGSAV